MPTLFDMLTQAQNGSGMQALAQQYGLSMQQTQAAVTALLPAFSQGLQRNTADPYGLGAFMTAMASGQHAKYFEDATRAFSPQGVDEGNGILGHLFGSKDLSRAVASQAAQASGVSQQILQQMLPVIASMVMGGLFKQTTGQMPGAGNNPLSDIIGQMMRQGGMQAPRSEPQQPNAMDNPFGKILQDMFGGAAEQPQSQPQQMGNPYADNPLGKALQDMFGGAQQPQQPARGPGRSSDNPLGKMFEQMLGQGAAGFGMPGGEPAQPEPQPLGTDPGGRPRNPFDGLFGQMFETGAAQRSEYQKGMETLFDQFKKAVDHR
jgi:hypothetical protein